MLFHSPAFLLGFLPLALAAFFMTGRALGQRAALLSIVAASLVFYGWWNPWHVPLLAGSVLVNYGFARLIRSGRRPRAWQAVGIATNLLCLGWFKYADFLLHIVSPGAPKLDIALPLAISFFTFQQIMFLTEAHRHGRSTALLPYAAFVTFFPHLIAGPIVRPSEIVPQFLARDVARPRAEAIADGLLVFLLGLGKKCILADMFGSFADIGFAAADSGSTLTLFEAWYATLSYALQIYFDFSGYSDMALGLARMVNIRFPLNFDSPYQAGNIADFWRRWHITLGAFLRDHVYVPLGGNRRGTWRQTTNLLATMLLAGLWHGAAWNFVLWGLLHGLFLAVHAGWRRLFRPLPASLGQILTLAAVILAWVPFRAGSFDATMAMLRGLAGLNGIALPRMIIWALPPLGRIAEPVSVLPALGDARTLSFPELTVCLIVGWLIVLALPNVHRLSLPARRWALGTSFALSVQAAFFAPHAAPFLYFQF